MNIGWKKLLQSSVSTLSYKQNPKADIVVNNSTTKNIFRNDGRAVYSHAIQWVVTGDKKHAEKAINILNDWAGTFKKLSAGGNNSYTSLVASWNVHIWMAGAEIIAHYKREGVSSGWLDSDIQKFNSTVGKGFKDGLMLWNGTPQVKPEIPKYSGTNCAFSVALSRMSLAIFMNDEGLYNTGKDYLLKKKMWSWLSGTLVDYSIGENGEVYELNRENGDCPHASGNVNAFILCAELLWHQGYDLYDQMFEGETVPRIFKGTEYFAKAKVAPPVKTTSVGNMDCSKRYETQGYEAAYNHYKYRLKGKYKIKYLDKATEKVRPSTEGGKFLPWSTVTHADLSKELQSNVAFESVKLNNSFFMNSITNSKVVTLNYSGTDKNAHVKIYDLFGKLVRTVFVSKSLRINGLNHGVYLIKLYADGANETKKIFLNR